MGMQYKAPAKSFSNWKISEEVLMSRILHPRAPVGCPALLQIAIASNHLRHDIGGIAQRAVAALLAVGTLPAALAGQPCRRCRGRGVAPISRDALLYQSPSNFLVGKRPRPPPQDSSRQSVMMSPIRSMNGAGRTETFPSADVSCVRAEVASFAARPAVETPSGRPGSCDCSE